MITLESQLADAVMNSGFAEEITITPFGGIEKTIQAIVNRSKPNPHPDKAGRSNSAIGINGISLTIYNDELKGVTSIKENFTSIKLPLRIGGAIVQMRIKKVLDHDIGLWNLEAEK